jgi:hypothetical protein
LIVGAVYFVVCFEVPELVIWGGLAVAVNPPPDVLVVRETLPVNPSNAVTVIVEVPCEPLLMLMLFGDVEMEKSGPN